jgi:hypothetical protein
MAVLCGADAQLDFHADIEFADGDACHAINDSTDGIDRS